MAKEAVVDKIKTRIAIKEELYRELLAELGATFLLVFIGCCNSVQFVLSRQALNTWIQVNLGWGFAITFSAYTAARTSGAHMNPAVSMLLFCFGRLPLKKLVLYSLAQTIGAFFGAAATYFFYQPLFDHFDGGVREIAGVNGTAGIFASYPGPHLGFWGPYVDQIVGTGMLCFFICLIVDEKNEIPQHIAPVLIGAVVMMIGMSFGANLGYPINPARDLGPRLFSVFVYGAGVFDHPYPYYWLAPIIGPLLGAPLAGWIYQVIFGAHLPDPRPIYRMVDAKDIKVISQ